MMSQKHSAFALMALGSVCVMFTSSAGAVPLKRTQEDVRRIVAQQKAELEANDKRFEESRVYPFFSRYQSPGLRPVKHVELRTVLKGSLADETPEDYNTRVVKFAPRRGVDIIDCTSSAKVRQKTL